ncbi:glycosyltransferase family 2 protein [Rudanella lutea]|uniref:glycosyltransferase family 2 protein n=1 Tax=Rudanella lutea TaxID=451374 RepID=UPI000360440B|nr:glycosyltransferase family 2 protein [Rudanella lutea]
MHTPCSIACLIPFYNEGDRLLAVLDVVTRVPGLAQIVCVDDGSNDPELAQTIRQRWPRIRLLQLPDNKGKTAAIRHGLSEIRADYVLLMDADLQQMNRAELSRIVRQVRQGCPADMLILRRLRADWFVRMSRADVLLSGERIIRRADLEAVLSGPVERFQLEVAINEYMQQHQKRVCWVPWSAKNTYKTQKRGPVEGFVADAAMYASIVGHLGVASVVRQYRSFARKPLRLN